MSFWSWATSWLRAGLTPQDDELYRLLGGIPTHTEETVTATSVMGLSTAWACVNLLAGTISSLSLDVNRKDERNIRVPASDHPLQGVLDDPNADQTPIDFWESMVLAIELWGNAYAEIGRRGDGAIVSLTPVRPEIMQVERQSSGRLRYRWYDDVPHDRDEADILHIRGKGGDPISGMSTISWNRNTFGMAQAIERAAGKTFANGVRASGVLMADPGKPIGTEKMEELRRDVDEKYAGAMNAGRPLILNAGFKWEPISFNPEEAQMLESRGFSVEEICRIFDVPPFMVGHTEKVTSFGSGLEQQILGFQKFSLRKRLKKIEQATRKQLLTTEERRQGYGVSFNLEDLLRGDSAARAAFYKTLLDTKVLTINEVRGLEGRAPVDWGDAPWVQMQDRQIGDDPRIGDNGGPPLEEDE